MDWNKEKIIQTVQNLQTDAKKLPETEINKKYQEFKEKFPKLFYGCLSSDFSMKTLEDLINFRDKAQREDMPDLIRDVSVSEEFAKKYLYPVVGEPSIEQKKQAAKKIATKLNQGF